MIWHIGMHGSDDADVVRTFSDVGEEFTDLDPTLAVLCEFEGGTVACARLAFRLEVIHGQGLAMVLCQKRLGIKGVDLRRPAIHEEVNDAFCAAKVLGGLRSQRVQPCLGLCLSKEATKGSGAHAHANAREEIASGVEMVAKVFRMMAHDLVNKDELIGGEECVGVGFPAIGELVRRGPVIDEC